MSRSSRLERQRQALSVLVASIPEDLGPEFPSWQRARPTAEARRPQRGDSAPAWPSAWRQPPPREPFTPYRRCFLWADGHREWNDDLRGDRALRSYAVDVSATPNSRYTFGYTTDEVRVLVIFQGQSRVLDTDECIIEYVQQPQADGTYFRRPNT